MTEFTFSWSWPTLWFWLLLPVLLLIAWWSYHRTVPEINRSLRWLLLLLRSLSLLLILLLLWNPVLQLRHSQQRQAETAILIDASLSMAFPSAKQDSTRLWLTRLQEPFRETVVNYFLGGDSLIALGDRLPEEIPCDQPVTDLALTLEQLLEHYSGRNLQAVLLLTDGAVNRGNDPGRVDLRGLPLYTVGIGDSLTMPDAGLQALQVDPVIHPGDSCVVTVTVNARGMAGNQGELRLKLGDEQLLRRSITLPAAQFPLHEQFQLQPEQEGRHKLQVELITELQEETDLNNSVAQYIDLQRRRHLVRTIAGVPSFDLEIVSFLLNRLPDVTVENWLVTDSFQLPEAAVTADLTLLFDFPSPETDPALLQELEQLVNSQPAVWIPGAPVDPGRLAEISGWQELNHSPEPQTCFAQPLQVHPVLGVEAELQQLQQRWRGLPPVVSQYSQRELPAGAETLLSCGDRPLLVVRENESGGRVAWLLARDCWRWHLQMQEDPSASRLYGRLWQELLQWLTVRVDERELQIAPLQEIFQENQPVLFQGLAINESRQPVTGAELELEIGSDSLSNSYRFSDLGGGRYQANLGLLPEGDYSYRISGRRGGYHFTAEEGPFSVAPYSIEFQTPVLHTELLRRLALSSGGLYLNEAAAGWQDELLFYDQLVQEKQDHLLRNKWLLLSVILMLLFSEWFLRKYFHLL